MKTAFKLLALSGLLGLLPTTHASDIVAGPRDSANPWLASVQFIKFDLTSRMSATIKTGATLTGTDGSIVVPRLGSMSWCDPAANPLIPGNTDIAQCFGRPSGSQFIVLDFNKLRKKGVRKAYLRLTLKSYDDNDIPGDPDEDLVPALTVFQGRPDPNSPLPWWYPNKYQNDPGLADWSLKPFTGKATNNSAGWNTAWFGKNSSDRAVVTGKFMLQSGDQNYLTVAIGGDARHANFADQHLVNFRFDAYVDSKPLLANDSRVPPEIDACACTVGVTQWHPSMNHCMAIDLCLPLIGTADHCKTPKMCEIDGGR